MAAGVGEHPEIGIRTAVPKDAEALARYQSQLTSQHERVNRGPPSVES